MEAEPCSVMLVKAQVHLMAISHCLDQEFPSLGIKLSCKVAYLSLRNYSRNCFLKGLRIFFSSVNFKKLLSIPAVEQCNIVVTMMISWEWAAMLQPLSILQLCSQPTLNLHHKIPAVFMETDIAQGQKRKSFLSGFP